MIEASLWHYRKEIYVSEPRGDGTESDLTPDNEEPISIAIAGLRTATFPVGMNHGVVVRAISDNG